MTEADKVLTAGMRRLMSAATEYETPREWLNSLTPGLGDQIEAEERGDELSAATVGLESGIAVGLEMAKLGLDPTTSTEEV